MKVYVTGARGNLGRKLIAHLSPQPWCGGIVGLDLTAGPGDVGVTHVAGDLADGADRRWREALDGVDAVVHLAAVNPAPDCSWSEACRSFDMTANLLQAALDAGVSRFIFASSNHVMGQYKDPPLAESIGPGRLAPDLPPGPGTRWFDGGKIVHGVAYGTSKLMGERAAAAAAVCSGGKLTSVSVRIGWCQPGDNHPSTMSPSGFGTAAADYPDAARDLTWFRSMWLSNRDFVALMERAILAEASEWPSPGIVVNGMSGNAPMPWDLGPTVRLLGYQPQDDVWTIVGGRT